MNAQTSSSLQPAFRALGDPTRRAILTQLTNGEMTIAEVVDQFELSRTAVRKHLTILEKGNLITVTARGKERVTTLNPKGLKSTSDWFNYFNQYWDNALGSLESAINNNKQTQSKRK